jgi:hypothetical protein
MRDTAHSGCFGSCGAAGCVLLIAAAVLPVSTCFGGSTMRGYEAASALGVMVAHGVLPAALPIYATISAALSAIALMRGRVSRGIMLLSLPAPIAAIASASTPLQAGYMVWVIGVTAVSIGVVAMCLSRR